LYKREFCNRVDRLVVFFFPVVFRTRIIYIYRIKHTAIIYTAEIVFLYSLGTHNIRRRLCNYNNVCCHSQLCILCLFVYVCFVFSETFVAGLVYMHRPQPSGDECVCACAGNLPETSLLLPPPTSESQGFSSDDRQEFVQHDDRYTTTTYTRQKRSWHMRRSRWRWIYIGGSVIAANRLRHIIII